MKEQIMMQYDFVKAVGADREREAQRMSLVREAKQARRARNEKMKTEGEGRRRIRLRDPLKA
jgi:hypothetical protein